MTKFTIASNDANQTVFKFLKKVYSTTPLSVIYKWFRKKDIKLNNKRINDQKIILSENDELIVFDSNKVIKRDNFKYIENLILDVVYEDDNMIIVNKEANVEMHSDFNDSLDDMVKTYLYNNKEYDPEAENSFVVSHVHRLDKLTSGLVIYAKNKIASIVLLDAIQDKTQIEKEYLLETERNFPNSLIANGFITYDPEIQKSIYDEKNKNKFMKECSTEFKLIEEINDYSLVSAKLNSGRKHQIRATLEYYDFPIINDFRYGGRKIDNKKMIFLKAYKLSFVNLKSPLNYLNGHIVELSKDF